MNMEIGEYIPNHLGVDENGRMVTASGDYAHTPLIVYFYPKTRVRDKRYPKKVESAA